MFDVDGILEYKCTSLDRRPTVSTAQKDCSVPCPPHPAPQFPRPWISMDRLSLHFPLAVFYSELILICSLLITFLSLLFLAQPSFYKVRKFYEHGTEPDIKIIL